MPAPTTMTLRSDVLPASPSNPRLSRALRLRIAFAMLSLSHRMQNYRLSFKDFDQETIMWIDQNQIRYQIVAQYRDSKLVISVLGKRIYFIKSAHQIFSNSVLLSGFSQEEAALIGYIVGTESGEGQYGNKTNHPMLTHTTCECEV